MAEISQFVDLVNKYGVLPLLVFGIIFLWRERERERKSRIRWQRLALNALTQADAATSIAEFYREEQTS